MVRNVVLGALLTLCCCIDNHRGAKAFGMLLPTSCKSTSRRQHALFAGSNSAIQATDTVLVVGGTSGIGQLVTKKLAAVGMSVRATSRDKARGEEVLEVSASASSSPNLQVVELDLLSNDVTALTAAMQGASAVVISVGTTAFPTLKWMGGNNPTAIDDEAVARIATVAASVSSIRKVVLVTSIGVDRSDEMPFKVLNLFGVLSAKKAGEASIKQAAKRESGGYDYVIVRPGRLVGGPFTNLDIPKLLQLQGGAENGVDVALGDVLLGDCKRDACAECIVQCLTNVEAANFEFCIVSNEQPALTKDEWAQSFQAMQKAKQ